MRSKTEQSDASPRMTHPQKPYWGRDVQQKQKRKNASSSGANLHYNNDDAAAPELAWRFKSSEALLAEIKTKPRARKVVSGTPTLIPNHHLLPLIAFLSFCQLKL